MTLTTRLTPTGCLSSAQDRVLRMLAASSNFQAFVDIPATITGQDRIDAAKLKIWGSQVDEPPDGQDQFDRRTEDQVLRPFAQVWIDDNGFTMRRIAATTGYVVSGTCLIYFEQTVDRYRRLSAFNEERSFLNEVGAIMKDVWDLGDSGTDVVPIIQAILEVAPFKGSDEEENDRGDYWGCGWRLDWGTR